jgi:hypothetical protein
MPGQDILAAAAALYTERGGTSKSSAGLATVMGTGSANGRYDRLSYNDLAASNLVLKIKSAAVFGPTDGASTLILFSQPSAAYQVASYYGPFIQLTNFSNKRELDFNLPSKFLSVASALLVHTQKSPELKISFNDQFIPEWDKFFDKHMPKEVQRVGKPSLGWDPFPVNEGSLSSNSIYLTVSQNLSVDFSDFWANYACSIQFWILLFPKNGKLTGHVSRWAYWVESGLLTHVVAEILKPNLILGAQQLTKALQELLAQFPVKDVYYLPGRQVNHTIASGKHDVFKGNTLDDVTIVLG